MVDIEGKNREQVVEKGLKQRHFEEVQDDSPQIADIRGQTASLVKEKVPLSDIEKGRGEDDSVKSKEVIDVPKTKISAEVNEQDFNDTLFLIFVDDIATGREVQNQEGPYTLIRKTFIQKYGLKTLYRKLKNIAAEDISDQEKIAKAKGLEELNEAFSVIWNDHRDNLETWKGLIDQTVNENKDTILKMSEELEQFYGKKFDEKSFKISLAAHPLDNYSMANPEEEIGRYTYFFPSISTYSEKDQKSEGEHTILTTFHEMSHQQLQHNNEHFERVQTEFEENNEDLMERVRKKLNEPEGSFQNLTREIVTHYVDTYFAKKYFDYKKPDTVPKKLTVSTFNLHLDTDLIESYLSQNKEIDEAFIVELFNRILGLKSTRIHKRAYSRVRSFLGRK